MAIHPQECYLLQLVTMAWDKTKKGKDLHWPSASTGAARKGLKPLYAVISYAKRFWMQWVVVRWCWESPTTWKLTEIGYILLCWSVVLNNSSLSLLRIGLLEEKVISWHRNARVHIGISQILIHRRVDTILPQRPTNQPALQLLYTWLL